MGLTLVAFFLQILRVVSSEYLDGNEEQMMVATKNHEVCKQLVLFMNEGWSTTSFKMSGEVASLQTITS